MRTLVVLVTLAVAAPAAADIWVWRQGGVAHYTTDPGSVPPEYRDDARVIAREWERPPLPEEPPASAEEDRKGPVVVAAPVEAVSEREDEGFGAGYEAGIRAAQERVAVVPQAVQTVHTVQTVEVVEPVVPRQVFPVFGHPLPPLSPRAPRDAEDDRRQSFGPGGPPPLGAWGPSPGAPPRR